MKRWTPILFSLATACYAAVRSYQTFESSPSLATSIVGGLYVLVTGLFLASAFHASRTADFGVMGLFATGIFMSLGSYRAFHNPAPFSSRFTPWLLLLLVAVLFGGAFDTWRKGEPPTPEPTPPEPVTKGEKIFFRTMAVLVTAIGLFLLTVGGYLTRAQWERVTQWPRTGAVLVSKDIATAGARLIFSFEVADKPVNGLVFRWRPKSFVRHSLSSWEPGTTQKISYNPENLPTSNPA